MADHSQATSRRAKTRPSGRTATSLVDDPEYWRGRAATARAMADLMRHPESKRAMLEIANGYEQLARRAEQRAAGDANVTRDPG